MTTANYDVLALGHALVDILAHVPDSFLEAHNLHKGVMQLVDAEAQAALQKNLQKYEVRSGGSAANTISGLAGMGAKTAFVGLVKDDRNGQDFHADMVEQGVDIYPGPQPAGTATGTCISLVTEDADRTMQTCLGRAAELSADHVNERTVEAATVTYLEGYLWDPQGGKQAFLKAARLAHKAGRMVALSLSDPFCVDRHRDSFRELIENHVDILFANEEEICSLYQVQDFDEALQQVRQDANIAALTRSAKGSVIVAGEEVHVVDAVPPKQLVDTTGAGDLYASGFLYGLTHGRSLAECGRLGSLAASEVIAHMGARAA